VKAEIRQIFGRDPTQTLNPDECFALGGGFQAAIVHPHYRVNVNVTDVSQHRVNIEWFDAVRNETLRHELFKQFQIIPSTKRVPIKVIRSVDVRLFGDRGDLAKVKIETGIDEPVTVKLVVRLNPDGLLEVQEATYFEPDPPVLEPPPQAPEAEAKPSVPAPETETQPAEPKSVEPEPAEPKAAEAKPVEPKPAKPKPAEAEPEERTPTEAKPDDAKPGEANAAGEAKPEEKPAPPPPPPKKQRVHAAFTFVPTYGLTPKELAAFHKQESEMRRRDELEGKIDTARNELESYIFQMQNGLTRDFPECFDPAQVPQYQSKVNEVSIWFSDNEFDRLTLQEYEAKLKVLTDFGEPALRRRRTLQQLPDKVAELKDRASKAGSRLASTKEQHNHITAEEKAPLFDDLAKYSTRLDAELKAAEDAPKFKECIFDFGKAERDVATLDSRVTGLLGKPKPPPPKPPEPKTEEKKDEAATGADGEANPAGGDGKPADGEAKPADGEAKPADGEVKPADGEAKPADGEAKPANGEAKPAGADAKPADAEASPPPAPAADAAPKRPTRGPRVEDVD
jgi:hypothetical protein